MPRVSLHTIEAEPELVKPGIEIPLNEEAPKVNRDPRFPDEPSTDEEIRKRSGGPVFSSFCAYPVGVHFSGKHNDEEIILLLRAHRVTMIPWVLVSLGMGLLPVILVPVIVVSGFLSVVSFGWGLVLTMLWYLAAFTYAFLGGLYWYFNVGIVTNERIVDVDWNSITHHDVATALMSKVQDVRGEKVNVLQGIFDYGNVYVQTAGNERNVEFLNVPHPQLVVRKIQELMAREEKEWETSQQ